jgi:cell division protein FtsL
MNVVITGILMACVFMSAVQVVVSQHEARRIFNDLQRLEITRDELNEEWGRLQLEQSTWATDHRIETVARTSLNMTNPDSKSVVLLTK